jgi:redox-sensitive bicupin YhaK (pirin superfamily)
MSGHIEARDTVSRKSIRRILDAPSPHWVGDGFLVNPLFADLAFGNEISPFLMLDYAAPVEFRPSKTPPGVGPHPHKGFETVTIVYHGEVEHRDSAGNSGLIGPGDVQWMTAGSGLLHEEFHSREASRRGGVVSMAQLWVNLPARDKNAPPRYQDIRQQQIPSVPVTEGSGVIRVIAGECEGQRGPADTFTHVQVWDLRLNKGDRTVLRLNEGDAALLPVLGGSVKINGETEISGPRMVALSRSGATIEVEALSDALLLLLGGTPIDEPIAHYGPFVMNTQAEIRQAIDDFRAGKMGDL